MLVPVRLRYGGELVDSVPAMSDFRFRLTSVLPGAAIETVPTPGATRSGFAAQSRYVGPRELNVAIVSSARNEVPFVLDAPTVSTHGAFAGAPMPPYCAC